MSSFLQILQPVKLCNLSNTKYNNKKGQICGKMQIRNSKETRIPVLLFSNKIIAVKIENVKILDEVT